MRRRFRGSGANERFNDTETKGILACEACDFDYAKYYPLRGEGFIEAHHLKPLHTLVAGAKTRLEDLALLCANCHRMVHARQPWLTLEQLKGIISRGCSVEQQLEKAVLV